MAALTASSRDEHSEHDSTSALPLLQLLVKYDVNQLTQGNIKMNRRTEMWRKNLEIILGINGMKSYLSELA